MIVTGDGDIPLYLKVNSGNVDDKSVFVERLKEFKKPWIFEGICVADRVKTHLMKLLNIPIF